MENIITISNKLKTINKKLYIVGGFCRNNILKNNDLNSDIDLVTDALPEEIKSVLNVVWEVWKKYWTCIIKEWNQTFEITTFREDIWSINNRKPISVKFTTSLEIDSKRRDFTCNAIYFDPIKKEYIDPENWINDINNKKIRFVWNIEERINEDSLRILRFIRFKNKYWFENAEDNYWEILKNNTILLKNISIERIKQELDKIILWNNNTQALDDLKKIWFLKIFIPEIDCLEECLWNNHHLEWNVWIHTKMCLEQMNIIIKREIITDKNTKLVLLWWIILHDIWKYPTYTIDEKWNSHYYNHEHIWAELFKNTVAKNLLFSKKISSEIYFIITEHLRLFLIPDMKKSKSRKLMMNKYFKSLLLIWEADNKWRIPAKLDRFELILNIYNNFQEIIKTKKFLTGKEIIKKYPELKWKQIWEKLKVLNEQILIKDT